MKKIDKSFAKINLHLAIGDKREDNFHNLQSIFAKISLYDIIEVDATISDCLKIKIIGLENCELKGDDTVTKAIKLWCEKSNINLDIKVKIEKNIPIKAGLGGGSSNGATVLLMLNEMFNSYALDEKTLLDVGLMIGSDVPFFLYKCNFAYVEGQGEKITIIDKKFNYNIFLVKPEKGVSTKNAFNALDLIEKNKFVDKNTLIEIFKSGLDSWIDNFYNDFESVVDSEILEQLKEDFKGGFVHLTGSGSTCYCIYDSDNICYKNFAFYEKNLNKNYTKSCFFSNI